MPLPSLAFCQLLPGRSHARGLGGKFLNESKKIEEPSFLEGFNFNC